MLKVFCVYDDKAKAYLPPFFLPEMGMATRAFADAINDKSHAFGRHPADYTLFCCGTFDDRGGKFDIESTLLVVAHGIELVDRVEAAAQVPLALNGGSVVVSKESRP